MDKQKFKEKYSQFIATNIVASEEGKTGSTLLLVLRSIGLVNISFIDHYTVNIELFKFKKAKTENILVAMALLLNLDIEQFNSKFAGKEIDLLDADLIEFFSNSDALIDAYDCLDLSDLFYELATTGNVTEEDAIGLAGFFCDKPAGKIIAYAIKSNLYNNKPIYAASKLLSKNKYAYKTLTAELLRDFYKDKISKTYIKSAMLTLIVKYHANLTKALEHEALLP